MQSKIPMLLQFPMKLEKDIEKIHLDGLVTEDLKQD
jgi:hypothetical protein